MDQAVYDDSTTVRAQKPAPNLCNRNHTLDVPKGFIGRSLQRMGDLLESGVAKVSVNGDPHIYDSATCPGPLKLRPVGKASGPNSIT
jgi:hypothetical protein